MFIHVNMITIFGFYLVFIVLGGWVVGRDFFVVMIVHVLDQYFIGLFVCTLSCIG